MQLDIRFPLGWLFVLLGAILTVYGLVSGPVPYRKSLGIDVNLWWGLVMLVFGLLMAAGAARARPRKP